MNNTKLYGREKEYEALLHDYKAVCAGENAVMFIDGPAGIGKTTLVKRLFELAPTKDGYFLFGKFEQMKQHMPYSAFGDAFGELTRQILAENEESFSLWKKKLSKLHRKIEIIADAVPEINLIVGKQSKSPEPINPKEAQARFILAFCELIRTVADQDSPLVIFMDDLQWADPASLQLIKYICLETEIPYMLLICAYRDGETVEGDLTEIYDRIKAEEKQNVSHISIRSLRLDDEYEYLADTLHSSGENVLELSKLLYRRTRGNPFLLKRFLKTVCDEGILSYSMAKSRWEWDLERIEKLQTEENTIRFTKDALFKLSAEELNTIKLASCIGSEFDTETLASLGDTEESLLIKQLEQAVEKDFILSTSKICETSELREKTMIGNSNIYTFTHDCIRQAAYSLISEQKKQEIHLRIGRGAYDRSGGSVPQEKLFCLVNHYDEGIKLLSDPVEKLTLARLNLSAGKRAKELAAYDTALYYYETGRALLTDVDLEKQDQLVYELGTGSALCMYLCGDFQGADNLFDMLLSRFESGMDQANIYSLKSVLHTAEGNNTEAVQSGLKALACLGVGPLKPPGKMALAVEIMKWKMAARGKKAEDLIRMRRLNDPVLEKISEIYMNISAPSNVSVPELFPLILLKLGNITFRHGNSAYSPMGYAGYALVAGSILGDFKRGREYEKAAAVLCEKYDKAGVNCITYFILGAMISHWTKHMTTSIDYTMKCIDFGREAGDFLFEGFGYSILIENIYLAGFRLDEVSERCLESREFLKKFSHSNLQKNVITYEQVVKNLKNWKGSFYFSDEDISKEAFMHSMEDDNAALFAYYFMEMQLSYLFEEYETAKQAADRARPIASDFMGYFISSDFVFFDCLVAAALYEKDKDRKQKKKNRRILKHCLNRLKSWADICPNNFEHKYLLISAEWERINGADAQAMKRYDNAIRSARENGFCQNAALACELAGRYYRNKGLQKVADVYLGEAYNGYALWGADGKAAHLKLKNPWLNMDEEHDNETQKNSEFFQESSAETDQEDMISRAVRNISDETEPDKILGSFLKMALENTGADRGILILERNGRLFLEASMGPGGREETADPVLLDKCDTISKSMARYVFRTLEPMIHSDGKETPLLRNDPYIANRQPKSILCLPILLQGIAMGVLYLEGDSETGRFTLEKLDVLKLLSTQMFYINKLQQFMENELLPGIKEKPSSVNLSMREGEVLALLAQGLSNKEIAKKLGITVNTVKVFVNGIYNKLGVSRRVQAVIKGRELNLFDS